MDMNKKQKHPCFWCDKLLSKHQLTKDHVVPLGLGGSDKQENVVKACNLCNNERGRIVGYFYFLREFRKNKDHNKFNNMEQYCNKLPQMLELQKKWVDIEKEKWGKSPSAKMKLELIDGRTGKPPKMPPSFHVLFPNGEIRTWRISLSKATRAARKWLGKNPDWNLTEREEFLIKNVFEERYENQGSSSERFTLFFGAESPYIARCCTAAFGGATL